MSRGTLDRRQTARLACERVRSEHLREVLGLLLDPRVAAWLSPTTRPASRSELRDGLAAGIAHWDRYGFGLWMVRDRHDGSMVGRGGLQWTRIDHADEIEAAWAIVPERWGQGLATELAHACVEAAFEDLETSDIVGCTRRSNAASRRVMEKAGFCYERDMMSTGLVQVLYRRRSE